MSLALSFFLATLLLMLNPVLASASSDQGSTPANVQVHSQHEDQKWSCTMGAEFTNLISSNNTSAVGLGGQLAVDYGITRRLGLGMKISESYSGTNFSSLYTAWGLEAVWALTGSMIVEHQKDSLGDWNLISRDEYQTGGWKILGGVQQYFINGSSAAVAFTGVSAQLRYEIPTAATKHGQSTLHYFGAVGYDSATNGYLVINPIHATLGILLWL